MRQQEGCRLTLQLLSPSGDRQKEAGMEADRKASNRWRLSKTREEKGRQSIKSITIPQETIGKGANWSKIHSGLLMLEKQEGRVLLRITNEGKAERWGRGAGGY